MPISQENSPTTQSLLLFGFALFLFMSPFAMWWLAWQPHWLFPYALWLALIPLTWRIVRRMRRHEL